ncbi:SDR family oxidoreductase [Jatrophihabitans sp.]|uniref:SDR family oxidoreductase n=1 Tax=Jatrophihabitans sp. TaxID=1932789 RepID=UPI0030C74744|nr:badH [Jatrophihabitans sp.]
MPTVLVTGASRGIGRVTALRLAADGWTVHAGVRSEADGKELAAAAPSAVAPVILDVTSAADLAALPERLGGRLDAVVNNAGYALDGPIETLAIDDLRRQYEVNVVGQVAVTQAVLPLLRASHGRIVFVSSLSGRISTPMTGAYNSSKFAIEGIADALRVELRRWKLPVVLVEPGPVSTDMWHGALDQHEATLAALSPEHRELYGQTFENSRKVLAFMQKQAVPVEKVAAVIEKALSARRPKARYQVDVGSRVQLVATGFTPTRVLDAILGKAMGTN